MSSNWLAVCFLTFASCQCAQVPDVCFRGECDAGVDAGANDAGVGGGGMTGGGGGSTGGGGGMTGGDGGMTGGGGVTGGGGGAPTPPFCDTWTCVTQNFSQRELNPPTFTVSTTALPTLTYDCPEAFLGGVLMPDDSVLAIPFCADHFVLIDAVNRTAQAIGPALPTVMQPAKDGGMEPAGRFTGGVLLCDGYALAIPARAGAPAAMVSIDGGFSTFLYPVHTHVGAVLDGDCSNPSLVYVEPDATGTTQGKLRRVNIGGSFIEELALGSTIPRGVVRRADDVFAVIAGGSMDFGFIALDGGVVPLNPASGSPTAYGAAITREGGALLIDATNGGAGIATLGGGNTHFYDGGAPTDSLRWPRSRGDGYVCAVNDEGLWLYDDQLTGGITFRAETPTMNVRAWNGLVAHPNGDLVAIPGTARVIKFYTPATGRPANGDALRSPWFNKL
ncbi:MAG: hypothetical protein QM817_35390 [Archangium sp.]